MTDLSPPATPGRYSWSRIKEHPSLVIGGGMVLLIVLMAVFAPVIAPHDPLAQNITARTIPPVWYENGSWEHILGTDQLGRDYLSRLIYGARVSLFIGFAAVSIAGVIGTVLGLLGGYFGGRIDSFVTFVTTIRLSLPVILVALAVVAVFGGSITIVVIVLGLLKWDRFAVVIRATTAQIARLDYIRSAQAAGASTFYILTREVLPNLTPQLIVIATIEIASAILMEAALSFLGLGVQPPTPSWGLMISEAKAYMFFSFWLIAIPGLALATLVFAINMAGDGLRDLISPDRRG
ncbi:ABC transporter permease [Pararhodobacter marinus]|uniref:Peptide ABC transporter permease n=1 Tax=Pararhodobacter marinus TaxID=2184063 RepID=A0A2U2C6U7_9RHOB|nr:ABC transporter permease [Pararhodobacter marinus]PWE27618.1 peptide ABC transporter permease [Pararhodobacter marinus]